VVSTVFDMSTVSMGVDNRSEPREVADAPLRCSDCVRRVR
jgi:hypothetical protein